MRGGLAISHLQFADKTLFFYKASREKVKGHKAILRCFRLVSRLGINLGKSTVIGVDLDQDTLNRLVEEVDGEVGGLPLKYLGLPI